MTQFAEPEPGPEKERQIDLSRYKKWQDDEKPEYNPETVRIEFMNNFPQWMPGGFYRTGEVAVSPFTHQELRERNGMGPAKGNSELFLSKTRAQVFADVDEAIRISGVDMNTASQFHTLGSADALIGEESELELELMKVWEILRKQGYYQKDLMS